MSHFTTTPDPRMPPSAEQKQQRTMANINENNVYTGPDSLKKYFDPDCAPPLPLVELPPHLNPYYEDGVRIYAKMMSCHPTNNVKCMPAMNLLAKEVQPDTTKTIVEYSSGSTVISMSLAARVYHNIDDTRAYLSNKTSEAKLRLMQFFGLRLTLFGGPSQPEPLDPRGGIQSARSGAEASEAVINPNQYENDANWRSHIKWTGPQIHRQLPEINVICAGMGTSGTMTGLGTYFKEANLPSSVLAPGDRVPGPRSYALLAPVEFPWREAVDHIEHVGSHDSFSLSLQLCRNGLLCGPSSGFNLQGLFNLLSHRKQSNTLQSLAGPDGLVHAVFLCCDLPYQYMQEYFDKLGPDAFPPITNEHLTQVDLYRYDEAWELTPAEALQRLEPETLVIDFRRQADYREWHFPGALNIPLASLTASSPSPFFTPDLLAQQWRELETLFGQSFLQSQFSSRKLLGLCYDGDTSRIANSVLRASGFESESVKGGSRALVALRPDLPRLYAVRATSPESKADSVVDERSDKGSEDAKHAESSDVEA